MRKHHGPLIFVLIVLGFLGCAAYIDGPPRPAGPPGSRVEISLFRDALSPYGDWLWVDPWGWAWSPWDVEPGWRPYTDGHWVWTDLGWTWVSDRPWGWAPFHYGRWTWHDPYGWIWIPDTVWAPAWVAWRTGHGWIGWAPLPPQARWRISIGLDLGGLDLGLSIADHGWSFCGDRDFLDHRIGHRLAPLPRNRHLLRETSDATRYEEIDRRVAVRSFGVDEIEKQVGAVPRYRIEDLERPPHGDSISGHAVRVYRPDVKDDGTGREPGHQVPPAPPAQERPAQEPSPPVREKEKKEIEKRQAQDRRALAVWEDEQRQKLEKEQQRERRQPPAQEDPADLQRRQDEERRALRKAADREKQVLDNRAERKARAQDEGREKQKQQEKQQEKEKKRQARPKPPGAEDASPPAPGLARLKAL